jgi:hypothetical protein
MLAGDKCGRGALPRLGISCVEPTPGLPALSLMDIGGRVEPRDSTGSMHISTLTVSIEPPRYRTKLVTVLVDSRRDDRGGADHHCWIDDRALLALLPTSVSVLGTSGSCGAPAFRVFMTHAASGSNEFAGDGESDPLGLGTVEQSFEQSVVDQCVQQSWSRLIVGGAIGVVCLVGGSIMIGAGAKAQRVQQGAQQFAQWQAQQYANWQAQQRSQPPSTPTP